MEILKFNISDTAHWSLVENKSNQDPKQLEESTTEKTIELC